jgi:signal-transduction protein with cAMP-binding, CBS, and nucleotidyltransferase domain
MEDRETPLNVVPVVENGKLLGVLRLHDILQVEKGGHA